MHDSHKPHMDTTHLNSRNWRNLVMGLYGYFRFIEFEYVLLVGHQPTW